MARGTAKCGKHKVLVPLTFVKVCYDRSNEWTCQDLVEVEEQAAEDEVPMCACGREPVGNLRTHCLICELEPFGIAWQLERQGAL
jgi:hypothetical protein